MKLALGLLAHEDIFLLPRIFPLLRPHFDTVVVGYHAGMDGTKEFLDTTDAVVAEIVWTWNWGEARNTVIKVAEYLGATHMLMLDSDEAMLQDDLKMIREEFETVRPPSAMAFIYPRYEMVDDFEHFDPSIYPDYQARGFPLKQGFYYEGRVHEQLCRDGKVCSEQSGWYLKSKRHIWHYGKCKPTKEVALKYLNYDRMRNNLEPLAKLPEGHPIPPSWGFGNTAKFEGPRPL